MVSLAACAKTPIVFLSLNKILFARVREYTLKFFLPLAARKKLDSLELRSSLGEETVRGMYWAPSNFPELKS